MAEKRSKRPSEREAYLERENQSLRDQIEWLRGANASLRRAMDRGSEEYVTRRELEGAWKTLSVALGCFVAVISLLGFVEHDRDRRLAKDKSTMEAIVKEVFQEMGGSPGWESYPDGLDSPARERAQEHCSGGTEPSGASATRGRHDPGQ